MAWASVEIGDVAAEVSWMRAAAKSSHAVYETNGTEFRFVKQEANHPTVENTFAETPASCSRQHLRDSFWKLERSYDCNNIVAWLLSTCASLLERGIVLTHNGISVTNFFAVNGAFDTAALDDVRLVVVDPDSPEVVHNLGIYSTVPNHRKLAELPDRICYLLGRGSEYQDHEWAAAEKRAQHLKIPLERYVEHWWACFVLSDKTMIHVDLCGPAYDLYHYRQCGSCAAADTEQMREAPVYIVTSREVYVGLYPEEVEKLHPHKMQMTRFAVEDGRRLVRLPSEFMPFSHEKLSPGVTPTDKMLERHQDVLARDAHPLGVVLDRLVLQLLSKSCKEKNNMTWMVELQGILSKPHLNGELAKVIDVYEDRVAVSVGTNDNIRVLPSKLKLAGEKAVKVDKQVRTLSDMKETARQHLQEAEEAMLCPGDTVKLCGLQSSHHLNGVEGVVVERCHDTEDIHKERFVVALHSAKGVNKKIMRKNLTLVKSRQIDDEERSSLSAINTYFCDDAIGNKFYNHVLVSGNVGITSLTEPEILPAFEKLVHMKIGEVLMKSPAQQRQWEVILELTKRPRWTQFREFVQRLRSGLSPREAQDQLKDNELKEMMDICVQAEILKARH
eukprot:TRINITY_DN17939_c0_g1_i1.p1 TRINITY_DN17939_c0_g1~~TRINITY_DN17939_c0_g1_i1.p1  ORF type:complete len:646 (+),score=113.03 TRINITY_DN17939_c0_g1_i1:93-1940(+)